MVCRLKPGVARVAMRARNTRDRKNSECSVISAALGQGVARAGRSWRNNARYQGGAPNAATEVTAPRGGGRTRFRCWENEPISKPLFTHQNSTFFVRTRHFSTRGDTSKAPKRTHS